MKEFKAGDQYRQNELSLIPGGRSVRVVYTDGRIIIYDKIKNVNAYIRRLIKKSDVIEVSCEGVILYSRSKT